MPRRLAADDPLPPAPTAWCDTCGGRFGPDHPRTLAHLIAERLGRYIAEPPSTRDRGPSGASPGAAYASGVAHPHRP